MIKMKQNTQTINDQNETERHDSMFKRKQNKKTLNDQNETEHRDHQ